MATSSSKVQLKLLIDKNSQRVLFAEAGKDFVDFLFSLMSLPLGTVIALLTKNNMVGSIANLHESIESLNTTYLQPHQNKDSILNPKSSISANNFQNPLLLTSSGSDPNRKAYTCNNFQINDSRVYDHDAGQYITRNHRYVADVPNCVCPDCNKSMNISVSYVAPPEAPVKELGCNEGGFVKDVVTYMILDNLEVKPMSTISGVTLLNKFNVLNLSSLEEREIQVGVPEGLKLLKESLHTKTVLTSVFLQNKMDN